MKRNDQNATNAIVYLVRVNFEKHSLVCEVACRENSPLQLIGAVNLNAPLRFKESGKGEIYGPDDMIMFVQVADESAVGSFPQIFSEGDHCRASELEEFDDCWQVEADGSNFFNLGVFFESHLQNKNWAHL